MAFRGWPTPALVSCSALLGGGRIGARVAPKSADKHHEIEEREEGVRTQGRYADPAEPKDEGVGNLDQKQGRNRKEYGDAYRVPGEV